MFVNLRRIKSSAIIFGDISLKSFKVIVLDLHKLTFPVWAPVYLIFLIKLFLPFQSL